MCHHHAAFGSVLSSTAPEVVGGVIGIKRVEALRRARLVVVNDDLIELGRKGGRLRV
jgi:hypothetical protein